MFKIFKNLSFQEQDMNEDHEDFQLWVTTFFYTRRKRDNNLSCEFVMQQTGY